MRYLIMLVSLLTLSCYWREFAISSNLEMKLLKREEEMLIQEQKKIQEAVSSQDLERLKEESDKISKHIILESNSFWIFQDKLTRALFLKQAKYFYEYFFDFAKEIQQIPNNAPLSLYLEETKVNYKGIDLMKYYYNIKLVSDYIRAYHLFLYSIYHFEKSSWGSKSDFLKSLEISSLLEFYKQHSLVILKLIQRFPFIDLDYLLFWEAKNLSQQKRQT